jgi:glutathione S-transferase
MLQGSGFCLTMVVVQYSHCSLWCERYNRLPIEEKPVALRKFAQKSPEYLSINPLGKVPCIQVGK